jgi:hypothetical protein
VQPTPRLAGARASFLSGISCPGPRDCTAAGYANLGNGSQAALAEHWDGRRWTIQPIARVDGELDVQLADVSCAVAGSCVAVGFFTDVTGIDVMLAERSHGARWTPQKPLYPPGARSVQFAGVSCPTARTCIAVGLFNTAAGSDALLAERADGSRWTIRWGPAVPGASATALTGVSCPSPAWCIAVGSATTGAGVDRALAVGGA